MTNLKNRTKFFERPETAYFYFLVLLIIPNVILCFTENMPLLAALANVIFPLGLFGLILTHKRKYGSMFLWLFPFVLFAAVQIIITYLFGRSIIAVDMFLNILTTNPGEATELLGNILPALILIAVLYLPPIFLAIKRVRHKSKLQTSFAAGAKKSALATTLVGVIFIALSYTSVPDYTVANDLFPINVLNNLKLAIERESKTRNYYKTSKDFTYEAKSTLAPDSAQLYIMVIGETSRAENWELAGYSRKTNPKLSKVQNLVFFDNVYSECNTTHKSVPVLMSDIYAPTFDSIYYRKGIITAFKEAGFETAFLSNQNYNHALIDFFGKEADTVHFIKEEKKKKRSFDGDLLPYLEQFIQKGDKKQFIVLHTYGSHFNYVERYPKEMAIFKPDTPTDAKAELRPNLINAYDNTIVYTDSILHEIIEMARKTNKISAVIYTSDHGEDIFDDEENHFLHSSPIPTLHQLHVPLFVWTSDKYNQVSPQKIEYLKRNSKKDVDSSASLFHTMINIAGIETPRYDAQKSLSDKDFTEHEKIYLNDHDESVLLKDIL